MFSEESDVSLAVVRSSGAASEASPRSLLEHILGDFRASARRSILVGKHVIYRRVLFGQMLENLAEATVVALFPESIVRFEGAYRIVSLEASRVLSELNLYGTRSLRANRRLFSCFLLSELVVAYQFLVLVLREVVRRYW